MIGNLKNMMENKTTKITAEKALGLMGKYKDIVVLDVRSKEEFENKNLPGSINIPLENIENTKGKVSDFSQKIIVYSNSTTRASKACKKLKTMGYKELYMLEGIDYWPY